MCGKCGLQPPDPRNLPQIAYHDGKRSSPGETMKQAADFGQEHFGQEPKIIFVLLPDQGKPSLFPSVGRCNTNAILYTC